jgi:hypothetical protein
VRSADQPNKTATAAPEPGNIRGVGQGGRHER